MKYGLFAALLLFAISSFAQVPGYLGKRFVLQVNAYPGVALVGPTSGNRGRFSFNGQYTTPGLNLMGEVEAGYVVSRNGLLSVSLGYMPLTGVIVNDLMSPSIIEGYEDFHKLFYHLGGFTQGINYYSFLSRWGGLAPMGFFYGIHVHNFLLSGEAVDKKSEYTTGVPYTSKPIGVIPSTTYTSIGLSYGFNKIVANRLLISTSIRVSIPTADRIISRVKTIPGEEPYMVDNNVKFRTSVSARMSYRTWLLFRMSVGLLN